MQAKSIRPTLADHGISTKSTGTGFYDDEVDAAVTALTSILEPIMIVVMGVVIGGVVIAMYLPMFDMINAAQG